LKEKIGLGFIYLIIDCQTEFIHSWSQSHDPLPIAKWWNT
jgi:hypothetical protein